MNRECFCLRRRRRRRQQDLDGPLPLAPPPCSDSLFRVSPAPAHSTEECQVHLPGKQGLPCGQEAAEPLPVLPLPEVPGCGHGEGRWVVRRGDPPDGVGQPGSPGIRLQFPLPPLDSSPETQIQLAPALLARVGWGGGVGLGSPSLTSQSKWCVRGELKTPSFLSSILPVSLQSSGQTA